MLSYNLNIEKQLKERICIKCIFSGKDYECLPEEFYRLTISTFNGPMYKEYGHKECMLAIWSDVKNEAVASCLRCGYTGYADTFYTVNEKGDKACDGCYCEEEQEWDIN